MRALLLLIIFVMGYHQKCHSQNPVIADSLQTVLTVAKTDSAKLRAILALSNYYFSFDYIKSLEYARQGRQFAQEHGMKRFEIDAIVRIGNIGISMGDNKMASVHYFQALKYFEETKDTTGIISINNNLGAAYDRLQEYDKALASYFKALEYLNASPQTPQRTTIFPTLYNNIANIYQSKGDPKSALQYYQKALALALNIPKHMVQGKAYNNIGKLYLVDFKQPEKAFDYLEKGLKVREEVGDQGEIARSLLILSDYYLKTNQFDKGLEYANRTLAIGKTISSLDIQQLAHDELWKLYESKKDFASSLYHFKEFKTVADSIRKQQANTEITRLQLQYEFEKEEAARLDAERQARIKYWLAISVLSVLLIVAILVSIVVRARAQQAELMQKNLSQDVEIKNKELTTNVMYLIRKNELINSVAERLLELEKQAGVGNAKALHDIIMDLQREADNDTWKEFELRFNQVHSDFYNKLRKLHPGLSPADEKLCAFLRLNMSSKEIAAITQQSTKSVEVARARLRKKLNLTNTTSNLVVYLSSI